VGAERGEFGDGRLLWIGGGGRRAVAVEAAHEDRGGLILAERAAVEKAGVRIDGGGDGREFHDGEAGVHEPAQGGFAARAEEAVTIANGNEAGGAMGALESGGGEEDRELAGTVADGVARTPRGAAQDGHAGDSFGRGGERDRGEAQGEETEKRGARHGQPGSRRDAGEPPGWAL